MTACEAVASALDTVLAIQIGKPLPRDRTVARVRSQLRVLLGVLGPDDRVAVLSYQSQAKIHCPLTANSGTTLSGILEALRAERMSTQGWRLRDRGETRSAAAAERVVTALLEKGKKNRSA